MAQLLSLDISCNVEIKLGTSSKLDGSARPHDNSAPDVDINYSADSDNPLSTFRQKAFVSRRHSLASSHGGYGSIKRDDNSSNFIHGILTGINFAGEEQGNFMSVRPPIAVYTFGKKVFCNINLTLLTLKCLKTSLQYYVQANQELVITVSPDSIKLMYHIPFEW